MPMLFAASYSASKVGLAGFTEALRSELSARSGIRVCGAYPVYVDTPTYLESKPHGPDPQAGAAGRPPERIAGLALRPRRFAGVGAANALTSVLFALAPDATGRLVVRLAERFLLYSRPVAATTDGGLWEAAPMGEAVVRSDRGGQEPGLPQPSPSRGSPALRSYSSAPAAPRERVTDPRPGPRWRGGAIGQTEATKSGDARKPVLVSRRF